MNIRYTFLILFPILLFCGKLNGETGKSILIDDFSSLDGWQITLAPGGMEKCEGPEAGNSGMKVKMPGIIYKSYGKYWFPASEKIDMDDCQGISLKVKGDGSDNFGYITVSDRYGYSYIYSFPLKNTQWENICIGWGDFIPQGEFAAVNDGKTALVPSALVNFQFGTFWKLSHNNKTIPQHEYCVDDLKFEKEVKKRELKNTELLPFEKILSKLKDKKQVRILCIGDSITVGVGLKNMEKSRYAKILEKLLREKFGYDGIYVESRAVGGSDLVWARSWLPRDFNGQKPDLVTIHFGYNDKSRKFSGDFFEKSLNDYLDRIAGATDGETAVLLLATMPGTGPRFKMLDDYAEIVKNIAKKRNLTCVDLNRTFKEIGKKDIGNYFSDMAHPNERGHELMARKISESFSAGN